MSNEPTVTITVARHEQYIEWAYQRDVLAAALEVLAVAEAGAHPKEYERQVREIARAALAQVR